MTGFLIIAFLIFGVAQMVAGYQGIAFELGTIWAIAAIGVAFVLRFTLPLTIGSFFGAMHVWGWHWSAAAVLAAPGLLLIIPGTLASIIDLVRRR